MTVVELLVAIGVFGIVLGLTVQLIIAALHISDEVAIRAELQQDVSSLLERLSRDLTEATHVETVGNRLLIFRPQDPPLEYTFVPASATVFRDAGSRKPCVRATTQVQQFECRVLPPLCIVRVTAVRRLPRSRREAEFHLVTTVRY